jgi:hypothetical protein
VVLWFLFKEINGDTTMLTNSLPSNLFFMPKVMAIKIVDFPLPEY